MDCISIDMNMTWQLQIKTDQFLSKSKVYFVILHQPSNTIIKTTVFILSSYLLICLCCSIMSFFNGRNFSGRHIQDTNLCKCKKNSFFPNNTFFPAPNYVSEKKVVLYKATFDFFATFFSKFFFLKLFFQKIICFGKNQVLNSKRVTLFPSIYSHF